MDTTIRGGGAERHRTERQEEVRMGLGCGVQTSSEFQDLSASERSRWPSNTEGGLELIPSLADPTCKTLGRTH